ncbi:MAG: hypothetical protein H3Z52_06745 [archaeon]|nr:hypothetical protein [archaeon]MCP8320622.1 hypothetical protein [archaeon]
MARFGREEITFSICLILGLIILIYGMGVVIPPAGWSALYVGIGLFLLGFPFSITLKALDFGPEEIKAMWLALGIIIAAVVVVK